MPPAIRPANAADLPAIHAISDHHVETGTGSFEEVPPTLDEMRVRQAAVVDAGHPWLVAIVAGEVAGFAYAAPWKPRSAYRFTVEDSVYVAPGQGGRGIGSALLGALVLICTKAGRRQMLAAVGDSADSGSIRLHERHGFRRLGTAERVGFKFGRWLDVVYLQRALMTEPNDDSGTDRRNRDGAPPLMRDL